MLGTTLAAFVVPLIGMLGAAVAAFVAPRVGVLATTVAAVAAPRFGVLFKALLTGPALLPGEQASQSLAVSAGCRLRHVRAAMQSSQQSTSDTRLQTRATRSFVAIKELFCLDVLSQTYDMTTFTPGERCKHKSWKDCMELPQTWCACSEQSKQSKQSLHSTIIVNSSSTATSG